MMLKIINLIKILDKVRWLRGPVAAGPYKLLDAIYRGPPSAPPLQRFFTTRIFIRLIIFAFFISLINVCYADTVKEKPLTLILDWFANPDHAPIFVAQQQGFFKQEGISVNIINPADPNDPPKLVAAG